MNLESFDFQPKNYKKLELTTLVIMAQNDDLKALEEIIKRVQNNVYVTLCYLEDRVLEPIDLTQEVLIKMASNIKKLKNPNVFKSWLNQITMRVFYDAMRKKVNKPIMYSISHNNEESEPVLDLPDKKKKPDEHILTSELDKKIKESIYNLPIPFRMPIILRELHGLSYGEIANSLNTNIGTVKSRIARARNKLQEELKPYIGEAH
ncbi:sigma-70 family RNA polymerase sigma factor [bacterium]|nr:sigma-70 family RNA polymerase sigma factor [bacterium]